MRFLGCGFLLKSRLTGTFRNGFVLAINSWKSNLGFVNLVILISLSNFDSLNWITV